MRNASGALFGLAYGDSLGKPTEFKTYAEIVDLYGPAGPRELAGWPALVTDDTQMMLAVGEALLTAELTPAALEPVLRANFIAWANSPDNNRAPGMTCLRACALLEADGPWQQATQINSKGCGANMRVTPVGLIPDISDEDRAGLAQFQAALTHGHPTALAASELTAFAPFWLRSGVQPADLLPALRERCSSQRGVYHERWLGDLHPPGEMAHGWDECAAALDRVAKALQDPHPGDPCLATGAGWIAEEALATALYCYLLSPTDPVRVIAQGATSSGDSDSIACLAGSFAGAALGLSAWPEDWQHQIEYSARLATLGAAWD